VGHAGCFRSINTTVERDAKYWRMKILTRPKLVTKRK